MISAVVVSSAGMPPIVVAHGGDVFRSSGVDSPAGRSPGSYAQAIDWATSRLTPDLWAASTRLRVPSRRIRALSARLPPLSDLVAFLQ
ncbi:hypothetical protein AB0J71_42250 [Nonomuraea sp. NPDC049637]|uniref:hypothetical protein n=1 Tax=Nonomuraea sp. NPDC049637 TaxID=3154356 RepID=UPI003440F3D9